MAKNVGPSNRWTQSSNQFGGNAARVTNSMVASLTSARHGFTKRATIRKVSRGGG